MSHRLDNYLRSLCEPLADGRWRVQVPIHAAWGVFVVQDSATRDAYLALARRTLKPYFPTGITWSVLLLMVCLILLHPVARGFWAESPIALQFWLAMFALMIAFLAVSAWDAISAVRRVRALARLRSWLKGVGVPEEDERPRGPHSTLRLHATSPIWVLTSPVWVLTIDWVAILAAVMLNLSWLPWLPGYVADFGWLSLVFFGVSTLMCLHMTQLSVRQWRRYRRRLPAGSP